MDGFPIFEPMLAEGADFFLALGDMIYSDRPITAEAPRPFPKGNDWQIPKPGPGYVTNIADFRRDWLYYREDRPYDGFLRATPLVATWDDHEIVNDSGGPELTVGPTAEELARDGRLRQGDPSRPRGEVMPWSKNERRRSVFFNPPLYAAARQAMFEWNPVAVVPDPSGAHPRRLYRSLRWGAHAEVFVLDTRSYRDPRYRIDSDAAPKTMLGAAQKRWLLEGLARSDATWKLVVSSVPLSLGTGNERDLQGRHYRDAWAAGQPDNPYGYGRELKEIVAALRDRKVANVLFLTGDQHYSNLFAYDPDGDGRADFHEANIGALRAGGQGQNEVIDAGLNPKRLFTDAGKASFAYGAVHVDGEAGRLTVSFHGEDGAQLSGARLVLEPASR
jgi:alkaline phosphatase D